MFFSKNKNNKELIKLEIDLLWKLFLILNGVFLVSLHQMARIESIQSMSDILVFITIGTYLIWMVYTVNIMVNKYRLLFKILDK